MAELETHDASTQGGGSVSRPRNHSRVPSSTRQMSRFVYVFNL